MDAEAARAQRQRMNEGNVTQQELVDALEQARVLTESLERMTSQLVARLELHHLGA